MNRSGQWSQATMVPGYDAHLYLRLTITACVAVERGGVNRQLLQKVLTVSDLRILATPATHPLMGSQLALKPRQVARRT